MFVLTCCLVTLGGASNWVGLGFSGSSEENGRVFEDSEVGFEEDGERDGFEEDFLIHTKFFFINSFLTWEETSLTEDWDGSDEDNSGLMDDEDGLSEEMLCCFDEEHVEYKLTLFFWAFLDLDFEFLEDDEEGSDEVWTMLLFSCDQIIHI